jgi:hypothetical protein
MALIPPKYLNALVSIEKEGKDKNGATAYFPIASGFFFGSSLEIKDDDGNTRYIVFLVTNRHVFEEADGTPIPQVFMRLNDQAGAKHYPLPLVDEKGEVLWLKHPNTEVDLAMMPLRGKKFLEEKIDYFFFTEENRSFLAKDFDKQGISPGHGVYVLGFPMGIRGENKNLIIVRQGIISRVDDEVLSHHYFYIDTAAFPGNSGGPVISKPEVVAIEGTTSSSEARLIGVISSGEVYSDTAVSLQTGRPRITFEEQTGIVRIVPVESILEIITPFMDRVKAVQKDVSASPTASEERIEGTKSATHIKSPNP